MSKLKIQKEKLRIIESWDNIPVSLGFFEIWALGFI
jgi:hypothetical protein